MKKVIMKFLCVKIALALFLPLVVFADSGSGAWYLVKHKGQVPGFPRDSEFLAEHNCFFIDKEAVKNDEKILYITFDAGYENGNIEKILNTLKEKSVPAAFFVLSNLVKKNGELITRMFDEGHLVCNHTTNHVSPSKMTFDELKSNLETLESQCSSKCNKNMSRYFRYPEGAYDKESVLNLEALGYKTFFWSMAYADWDNSRQPNPQKAIKTLLEYTHPGAIILLHPTSKTNAEIMPTLIDKWREMGYRFGTLDELANR